MITWHDGVCAELIGHFWEACWGCYPARKLLPMQIPKCWLPGVSHGRCLTKSIWHVVIWCEQTAGCVRNLWQRTTYVRTNAAGKTGRSVSHIGQHAELASTQETVTLVVNTVTSAVVAAFVTLADDSTRTSSGDSRAAPQQRHLVSCH